jgi:hypothetical protein
MSEKIELDKPTKNNHGWFVGVENDVYHYLHRDGVIRESIVYFGENMGYFATEAQALAAIEAYQAKQEATK